MLGTSTIALAEGVKLVKNVMIPMRDGVRLAADLYMPDEEAARFPVVMEYIPYRKDEVAPFSRFYEYLARHSYILARVDIRGTGGSEGINVDEYVLQEQLDGYDAIEWLAQQPWCDGHVNMMGFSYGGFSSLQVATHNPPHLTTIIPAYFTDDRYTDDCHYRGGLLRMYYDVGYYGNFMVAYNALPPYPEWCTGQAGGGDWARIWEQHLAHNEPYILKWLSHQTNDAYWRHGSVRDIPERIKCPVFMIGGWQDGYPNPPLRLYESLQVPRKLLMGPWNHRMPDSAIPGPRIDYLHEVVRWLDYWCKGIETGIMAEPPVTVYMQHAEPPVVDRLDSAGAWRSEVDWPPPGAAAKTFYLAGADRGSAGNLLGEKLEAADGTDYYAYDPTVGVTGGLWSGGIMFGLAGDQRPDEARSLIYTTPPLAEDVHILGWPRAHLYVASKPVGTPEALVMGFAASLADVAPDGASHLVAKGMLNGTRRASLVQPEPMEPGEIYELDIQIDATAWVFPKGHRIRLSIASADWPNVWPTPQPAINSVARGAQRPSCLVLPTVPAVGSATPPAFRPSALAVSRHSDAAHPPTWQVVQDVLTGRTSVKIALESDARVNATTVVHRSFSVDCQVDPADPARASAYGRHVSRIERPNEVTQARSDVLIQSTASHFHITIELAVHVNAVLHFSRRWVESLPRSLL
ncbi:MAG: CocE/NonD family hydrolase [Chloroflexi bacterium]|nr:CocE/NonD family hydrolase [Chloroflexota bacterium]